MLEVRGLTKSYGSRRVLHDVTFDVVPGRMTGFIGGNGAGKTTTMRIVLGVLAADAGEVRWRGAPVDRAARGRFGYMPEERGLYPKMRLAEQLSYLARLHGFTERDAGASVDRLLDRLGLSERRDDDIEKLSLGNQQRAQIAAALVHRPSVLILDEPFSGLDPLAVETVLGVLQEHAAAGAPVLFSSHQLDIVERLCDDVVIIADGAIRAAGDAGELRDQHAGLRYSFEGVPRAAVEGAAGIRVVDATEHGLVVEADSEVAVQELLRRAVATGPVRAFSRIRPSLAQTFREVIR